MYHCKILTLYHKSSERYVKIWCELVKKENTEDAIRDRLHSDMHLAKVDIESKDIFIREEERIRVEIKGNGEVNKQLIKPSSLLMTFIPLADHNHIFIPIEKHVGGHAYTVINYTKDRFGKGSIHSASFDPWSRKNTTVKRADSVGNMGSNASLQRQESNTKTSIASDQNKGTMQPKPNPQRIPESQKTPVRQISKESKPTAARQTSNPGGGNVKTGQPQANTASGRPRPDQAKKPGVTSTNPVAAQVNIGKPKKNANTGTTQDTTTGQQGADRQSTKSNVVTDSDQAAVSTRSDNDDFKASDYLDKSKLSREMQFMPESIEECNSCKN